MACYLGRAGFRVRVFEKRPDPRAAGFAGGRSINLALSTRGIAALRGAGLAETALADAIPMRGRMMHAVSGELTFQPYGTEAHQVINSISREGLNVCLLEAAARLDGVELHFDARVIDVDFETPSITVEWGSDRRESIAADAIVGADGAFSTVRAGMQRRERFDYQQTYLTHGYKELTIPPADDGGFRMEKNALHIWPRGGLMMIALPNADGSYTCTLFWPFEGPNSFAAVQSADEIRAFFTTHFPDVLQHMPNLIDGYREHPIGSLVTVRCAPWNVDGRAVLIGDAAHAVVPFYGQGMNASFEDCALLSRSIARHPTDLAAAFSDFSRSRKADADALADLAVENFIEMRDRVASPAFLLRKKLGRALHRLLPRWFVPIYTMVTFTTIPYAQAVERRRRQNVTVAVVAGVLAVTVLAAVSRILL